MAVVVLAMVFVGPAMPWRLDEEQRSGTWMRLATKWSVAGTGIWLWRFRTFGIWLFLAGFFVASLTATTMILIWGA